MSSEEHDTRLTELSAAAPYRAPALEKGLYVLECLAERGVAILATLVRPSRLSRYAQRSVRSPR
jgi:hypothetical protein